MALPFELLLIAEETAIVGNIDAFMEELESGTMAEAYDEMIERKTKELRDIYG